MGGLAYGLMMQVSGSKHITQLITVFTRRTEYFKQTLQHSLKPRSAHAAHSAALPVTVPHILVSPEPEYSQLFNIIIFTANVINRHKILIRMLLPQLFGQL